ncbi:hypothetical protein IG631_04469 [Alternaria alternata]|nr:hypothetical protein IG631_04469 [Alternaria alternata]
MLLECGAQVKAVVHILAHSMPNFRRASIKRLSRSNTETASCHHRRVGRSRESAMRPKLTTSQLFGLPTSCASGRGNALLQWCVACSSAWISHDYEQHGEQTGGGAAELSVPCLLRLKRRLWL